MPPRVPAGQLPGADHRHALATKPTKKPVLTGAFVAPDPLGSAHVAAFSVDTPAGKAAVKAKAKRDWNAAVKAHNDRLIDARNRSATARTIGATVSSTAGLPPVGSPFAGVSKSKAKAKDPYQENLTAKVQLAKATLQRLTQGGVLGPVQELNRYLENQKVTDSIKPTFSDTHMLDPSLTRPAVHLTPAEDKAIIQGLVRPKAPPLPTRATLPAGALPPVRTQAQVGAEIGRLGAGATGSGPNLPGLGNLWGGAKDAASALLRETQVAAFGGADPAKPGEPLKRGVGPFGVNTDPATLERAQRETSEILSHLGPSKGSVPHVPVDLSAFNAQAQAAINENTPPGQPIYLDDAVKYGSFGLGPAMRKTLIQLAVDGGHNRKDATQAIDADLAAMAYNPLHHDVYTFGQNAAQDIGTLGAGLNIGPLIADPAIRAIEQGSPAPLLRTGGQLLDQIKNHLIFVGDRPIQENLYNQPFTTLTSNVPIAKYLGTRVGKGLGMEATREVVLPTTSREAIARGGGEHKVEIPSSQNVFQHYPQKIKDAILARSVHPAEQRAIDSGTDLPLGATMKRFAQRKIENAGHRQEQKYTHMQGTKAQRETKLQIESDARHATAEYLKALRKQKTTRADILGSSKKVDVADTESPGDLTKQKISSKQTRAEILAGTAPQASTSAEIIQAYTHWMENSVTDAEGYHKVALEKAEQAKAAAEAGDIEGSQILYQRSQEAENISKEHASIAKDQQRMIKYHQENPSDPLNLTEKEQAVVQALKGISVATTDLRKGDLVKPLTEDSATYGDVYQRAAIVHVVEAPGTELGGEHGTASWQAVDKMLKERKDWLTLESELKKGANDRGISSRNSPAAREQRGRIGALIPMLKDLERRRKQADTRVNAAREKLPQPTEAEAAMLERGTGRARVPARLHDAAETAAIRAGAGKGVIRKITQSAKKTLTEKKAVNAKAIAAETKRADEIERHQLAMFEEKAGNNLRREKDKLKSLEARATDKIERRRVADLTVRNQVERVGIAQRYYDTGFVADERLNSLRSKIAQMEADNAAEELTPKEIDAITKQHLSTAQTKAIGKVVLHDAIHENLHKGRTLEIDRQIESLRKQMSTAVAKHEELAGSSAFAELEATRHHTEFVTAMNEFHSLQKAVGRDPFHAPLPYPGQKGPVENAAALGTQFVNAHYTRDIHIEFVRDLEQNMRQRVQQELLRKAGNTPYVIKDPQPSSEVPAGFLLADANNIISLRRPVSGTEANASLADEWTMDRQEASRRVPTDGKKYVLISDDLHAWLKDEFVKGTLDVPFLKPLLDFTNKYRRWMLFTVPRTFINNALGNPLLAMLGGAGIVDYIRAYRMLKEKPELIPSTMLHKGPLHNALQQQKMTGYQSFWRNANVFHEDLGRVTVYMHHVIKAGKHDQGFKFYNRIDLASDKMTELMVNLAEGKDPRIHQFTEFADHWFGDMVQKNKYDPVLSTAFLFHRWVGHMVHLALWTMPTKYPGRTGLLLNLSNMADEYRQAHGEWPDWARSLIPIWKTMELPGGAQQVVQWGLNTQGINPFATPGQTFDLGTAGQPKAPLLAVAASNITPPIRLFLEQMIGKRLDTLEPYKDQYGNPLGGANWRLAANQIIAGTPVANLLISRSGKPDDYVGGLDDIMNTHQHRYSAAGLKDPSYYPPSALGHGFWYDLLVRALNASGMPIRPVDEKGARTERAAHNQLLRQRADYRARLKHHPPKLSPAEIAQNQAANNP